MLFVEQELGGIITQGDMDSYTADWVDPVNVRQFSVKKNIF